MKKRLLLVLAFGVTFTPAVFASVQNMDRSIASLPAEQKFGSHLVEPMQPGQVEKSSQIAPESLRCGYADLIKQLKSEPSGLESAPAPAAIGSAGSARGGNSPRLR